MSSDTRAQVEAALHCRLSPITHEHPHHNTHYKGVTADGTALFIKLIDGHPAYYTAELRAQHHLTGTHIIPTPKIVDHGTLDDQRRWLAYEWHDLEPFIPDPDRIRRAGHLLGDFHAVTSGIQDDQLRRYADVGELITEKIALVAQFDPPLAERIHKISDQLLDSRKAVPDSRVRLLHGDMEPIH
jgi:Ser/Thr protein kinase RdoA (MazF antagonist)